MLIFWVPFKVRSRSCKEHALCTSFSRLLSARDWHVALHNLRADGQHRVRYQRRDGDVRRRQEYEMSTNSRCQGCCLLKRRRSRPRICPIGIVVPFLVSLSLHTLETKQRSFNCDDDLYWEFFLDSADLYCSVAWRDMSNGGLPCSPSFLLTPWLSVCQLMFPLDLSEPTSSLQNSCLARGIAQGVLGSSIWEINVGVATRL